VLRPEALAYLLHTFVKLNLEKDESVVNIKRRILTEKLLLHHISDKPSQLFNLVWCLVVEKRYNAAVYWPETLTEKLNSLLTEEGIEKLN